jgi:hypothetical protein
MTTALTTIADCGSETLPVMTPRSLWAAAAAGSASGWSAIPRTAMNWSALAVRMVTPMEKGHPRDP